MFLGSFACSFLSLKALVSCGAFPEDQEQVLLDKGVTLSLFPSLIPGLIVSVIPDSGYIHKH